MYAHAHTHTHTHTQVLDTEKELSQQFSRENLAATDGDLAEDQETAEADKSATAPEEADGEAARAPPQPPADDGADASFTLRLTLGVIEGLKDPNPPPPPPAGDGGEAGEGGGGGEAGEDALPSRVQVLYDFYVANPPLYYVEVSADCAHDFAVFDRAPSLAPALAPSPDHICARMHSTTGGRAEAAGSNSVLGKNPMECHTPP